MAARVREKMFCFLLGLAAGTLGTQRAMGQTVTIDGSTAKAIRFDPDVALGSSIDILPSNAIDAVYGEEILKESLAAGRSRTGKTRN